MSSSFPVPRQLSLENFSFNQSTLLLKYKFNIEVLIQDFIAYFKQGQHTSNPSSKQIHLFGDTSDRECLRYKYCKASGLANTDF